MYLYIIHTLVVFVCHRFYLLCFVRIGLRCVVIVAENIKKATCHMAIALIHKNTPTNTRDSNDSPFIFVIVNIELISNEFVFLLRKPNTYLYLYICAIYLQIHVHMQKSIFCCYFGSVCFPHFLPHFCSLGGNFSVVSFLIHSPSLFFYSQQCVHFIYSLIYICLHPFYFEC